MEKCSILGLEIFNTLKLSTLLKVISKDNIISIVEIDKMILKFIKYYVLTEEFWKFFSTRVTKDDLPYHTEKCIRIKE